MKKRFGSSPGILLPSGIWSLRFAGEVKTASQEAHPVGGARQITGGAT
jgi:hypothetical protein